MTTRLKTCSISAAVFLLAPVTTCGQAHRETVIIEEPGRVAISQLFKQSDVVAAVEILSGDKEHYDQSVCKAKVLTSWKGRSAGNELFFSMCNGQRLGLESIVFLRGSDRTLVPKSADVGLNYGTIRSIFEVQYQGYSAMTVSNVCVFKGKEISEQCGDGVRICTDYILLPNTVATFPPKVEETDFGCRWVRKSTFFSLMDVLRDRP
jgi:hypothetical protein